ncbi:hypothetical protein [Sphingopyxis sp.]|uniref:hypothetical protein n=1 Tax=Sphingopyxis sp. TaxID=1908224 RepID=UPI003D6D9D09
MIRRPSWRENLAECDRQIAQMERERPTVTADLMPQFERALAQLHAVRNVALDQMRAKA